MSQNSINKKNSISYKDAGVNIKAGDELISNIKPLARKTKRKEVLAGLGGFGSLFELPKKYKNRDEHNTHMPCAQHTHMT